MCCNNFHGHAPKVVKLFFKLLWFVFHMCVTYAYACREYLLSFRGLGLKSVECVRLLTLHHLAFPVSIIYIKYV